MTQGLLNVLKQLATAMPMQLRVVARVASPTSQVVRSRSLTARQDESVEEVGASHATLV